ncbi:tetratricopeptide repeat protein [uncultured Roseobacter sp.]|uniref:tetratricopeptide repeat protein n=1 Tax=uncultured Roseobacter sp. TaxID=114847 RepID=UPI00260F0254|nr:tetratricopeptide repeat protein [uncultured Roseobacter sp.]
MVDLATLPALLAAQDWPRAEKLLRRAAQKRDAPAEVFYNLAKVLEALDKPEQSRRWLKRAVTQRPGYASAWFELGRAALASRDLPAARDAFARAARLDPADADARRSLGRVALRLCDWDLAAQCFEGGEDTEARHARYRIAAETGQAQAADRAALWSDGSARALTLRTLTRVARGTLPLRLRALDGTASEPLP